MKLDATQLSTPWTRRGVGCAVCTHGTHRTLQNHESAAGRKRFLHLLHADPEWRHQAAGAGTGASTCPNPWLTCPGHPVCRQVLGRALGPPDASSTFPAVTTPHPVQALPAAHRAASFQPAYFLSDVSSTKLIRSFTICPQWCFPK